ncbi:MAG: hypothetical protein CSA33_07310 [Desulfobulbus propionicus]|nr:MAG: hypothetical protein CSA33_07310 [Desulfobulbus propionicus]
MRIIQLMILAFWFFCCLGHVYSVGAESIHEQALRCKIQAYKHYKGIGKPVHYAKAYRLYLQAAELGDAEAQHIVGGMLYKGLGTDPNNRMAFKWLLKAAKQGQKSPESMRILGGMYLRGVGVPQNYKEAIKWLSLAAETGELQALNDLAYIYYHGLTGERDFKKALKLYTKGAMRGDNKAMYNVGLMHATGTGTPVDKATGYAWYTLAASRGNTTARSARDALTAAMSWENLNRAQALAVDFYHRLEQVEESAAQPSTQ